MADAAQIDHILDFCKYGGLIVVGISGILGTVTETHKARSRKLTGWGWTSVSIIIIGAIVAGIAQFEEGSRQKILDGEAEKKYQRILQELNDQKEANGEARREFQEKIQTVLIQLNAAKQGDSKKITEEKLKVIQKDFSDWAVNFSKNLPKIKDEISQAQSDLEQSKLDEIKKETQASQLAFPLISFALRYVQEAVHAYAVQTTNDIKIDQVELPENLFSNGTNCTIHLGQEAVWRFEIAAKRPRQELTHYLPYLEITFLDANGKQSGSFRLQSIPSRKHFALNYSAPIPFPDPVAINREYEEANYETTLQGVLQRIIEVQLVHAIQK
jgi:hypothetical protein